QRSLTYGIAQRSEQGADINRLYHTARWQALRLRHLAREPLCRACQLVGRVTRANVADHKIPHHGNLTLFWSEANLQSLCQPCHGVKLAEEARGYSDALGNDGLPLDLRHPFYKG